ncbi:MAG: response regulator [Nitrospirae bacterium]|nr:response regulator [Nitrospirota bacterium]
MNILVVDDEQLVRWFLERALKRKGHDVKVVSSVMEALNLIKNENFDLIITDLRMPEENGSILVDKLCEMTNRPKIMVCSAYITPELDVEYQNRGIITLKKPFKLNELDTALNKLTAV